MYKTIILFFLPLLSYSQIDTIIFNSDSIEIMLIEENFSNDANIGLEIIYNSEEIKFIGLSLKSISEILTGFKDHKRVSYLFQDITHNQDSVTLRDKNKRFLGNPSFPKDLVVRLFAKNLKHINENEFYLIVLEKVLQNYNFEAVYHTIPLYEAKLTDKFITNSGCENILFSSNNPGESVNVIYESLDSIIILKETRLQAMLDYLEIKFYIVFDKSNRLINVERNYKLVTKDFVIPKSYSLSELIYYLDLEFGIQLHNENENFEILHIQVQD